MFPKFYIAAPFFNKGQTALVKRIEQTFDNAKVPYFSPRSLHPDFDDCAPSIETPEAGHMIFKANVNAIMKCGAMLAVLDYNLPPGMTLRAYHEDTMLVSNPIHLPDTGVVFECGVAHSHVIPIIGFTQADPKNLNVMLTRAMKGMLYGVPQLNEWLQALVVERDFGFSLSRLQPWTGKER